MPGETAQAPELSHISTDRDKIWCVKAPRVDVDPYQISSGLVEKPLSYKDYKENPLFLGVKILRLLGKKLVKNSSPFFSKLVRVRASNLFTLLIGIIKPYHYYYWYFLLRSLVGEMFAEPFHQAKVVSSSFTVQSRWSRV